MVVGDKRKYLTCLITLKVTWGVGTVLQVTVDPVTLAPTDTLDPRAMAWVASLGAGQRNTVKVNLSLPSLQIIKPSSQQGKKDVTIKVHTIACILHAFACI